MESGKYSHYAVRVGKVPGVYTSWEECEKQVIGFSRAKYRGFHNLSDAMAYVRGGSDMEKKKSPLKSMDSLSPIMAKLGVGLSQTGPTQMGMTGTTTYGYGGDAGDVDFVPETQGGGFLIAEEMELYLLRACLMLKLGSPRFEGKEFYSEYGQRMYYFSAKLTCEGKGLFLEVHGCFCQDEERAREDAAYNLLDKLLTTTGHSIIDFNYRRLCTAKQQIEEMQNMQESVMWQRLREAERERDALKKQVEIFQVHWGM
ncbi:hypothetical protein PIB30_038175 [Stylosanthes scabra]|uniref:Ribonuclease H1 N-terminal domain-containing protein n=1 Tax=Stylosanthes scabra TaxID=79078 RepID=A0ABU6YCC5_9FABA|nr:hypothetical protein [Stylosanthes scabra]